MSPPAVEGPTSTAEPPTSLGHTASVAETQTSKPQTSATIRTVDELLRVRARENPDKVIVSYPSSGINYVGYTMRQLDVFAYRVAKYYEQFIPCRQSSDEKPMTIAMIGPSNFDYLISLLAVTKLGHTTLFLSPRISQEAVDNLINLTGASYFLAHSRYLETAETSRQALGMRGVLEIADRSKYDFPVEVHADTRVDTALDLSVETHNHIYIIHSSGSTGLPKPIYQTQKASVANYVHSMEMKAFITLPLYHNHGICNLFRAIYCQKPIHFFSADLPLTHDNLVGVMGAHDFEVFYGVPYALKLLSESEPGMKILRNLKIVMYGGSACPDSLGNYLVQNGVNLIGHYGSTEVGQLMTSFRSPEDKDWNYLRESPRLKPFLRWIPHGANLYECCVLPGWPSKVASNQEDGSYATKDLFEPHPTLPGAWKYVARRDDTVCLVNGEMFNPVTTEGAIRTSKNVAEAVIFGAGKPAPGLLLVPSQSLDEKSESEILDIVWPGVEAACSSVEAYAKISKNMIKILPPDSEYPRTDKGSVIRHAFYKQYAKEIHEVYERAETSTGDLQKMDLPELKSFVRGLVERALSKSQASLDDDTDFFILGLDSLQAIQIRSEILRTVDVGGHQLGQTVVFDNPSIVKLSQFLLGLRSGETRTEESIESQMQALIEKYHNRGLPSKQPRSSVVVTGVTGSLGAHIVAKLAVDPSINTIYCLARAETDEEATQRVESSLKQRRAYESLSLPQRGKVVGLASNFSDDLLGLSKEKYDIIRQDLRTVIHSAWAVNFNIHLSSFEKGNIDGIANLISLCQASAQPESGTPAATFNFCSSVSTVSRATVNQVPESMPELSWAQGMGYAQSKAVAEHLCSRAAEKGVTARVLRIGQIIADTKHGIWNHTEAIPLMLQAAAVAEIALSDASGLVANIANPKQFDWSSDLLPALRRAGLEFEELEPKEWVEKLRSSTLDPQANPPVKLVDFFASKYDKTDFAPSKTYVTENACSLSPALAEVGVLDQELVDSLAFSSTLSTSSLALSLFKEHRPFLPITLKQPRKPATTMTNHHYATKSDGTLTLEARGILDFDWLDLAGSRMPDPPNIYTPARLQDVWATLRQPRVRSASESSPFAATATAAGTARTEKSTAKDKTQEKPTEPRPAEQKQEAKRSHEEFEAMWRRVEERDRKLAEDPVAWRAAHPEMEPANPAGCDYAACLDILAEEFGHV
ncbi:hypothetical protein NM208_g4312 [Fusarium decemcellulare]|uniref:Uncharacterized protein n=1 Tax=Fusarium decemcellulare TaxID=57161 RepID=A0ACC1SLG8_9HYPO|nr:hypothetical protein NM208_g4312 [Fusarium decemcellulare]